MIFPLLERLSINLPLFLYNDGLCYRSSNCKLGDTPQLGGREKDLPGCQRAAPHRGCKKDSLSSLAWRIIQPKVYFPICGCTPKMIPKQGLSRNHIVAYGALVQAGKSSITRGLSENQERHPKCFLVPSWGHSYLHHHP